MAASIPDGGMNKSQGSTTHTEQAWNITCSLCTRSQANWYKWDKVYHQDRATTIQQTLLCLCTSRGNGSQISSLLGEIFQQLQSLTWGHAVTQSSVPQLPTPRAMNCIELSLHFPHTSSPKCAKSWYMRYAHSTAKFCLWGSHRTCCSLINPQDPKTHRIPVPPRFLNCCKTQGNKKQQWQQSKKILILCCSPKRISANKSVEDSSDRAQEVQGFSGRLGLITASV